MRRFDLMEFLHSSWPWLLGLLVALGLLAWAIQWLRSRLFENSDAATSGGHLLDEYREMVRRGELSEEEYRFIKSRVGGRPSPAVQKDAPSVEREGDVTRLVDLKQGSVQSDSTPEQRDC
jgi:hypothetical protein